MQHVEETEEENKSESTQKNTNHLDDAFEMLNKMGNMRSGAVSTMRNSRQFSMMVNPRSGDA